MFIDWHGAENILRPCFFKEIDLPLYLKMSICMYQGIVIIRFNLMYIFLAYHVQRKLPQKLKVTHTTCCYMSILKFPIWMQ